MTFICSAKLEHGWAKKVAALALNNSDYMAFRAKIKNKEMLEILGPPSEFDATKAGEKFHYWDAMLMDADEAGAWSDIGVELQMNRIKGVSSSDRDITKTIYQISVANVGLMQIQRVQVWEDCCTDELQRMLDQGWRILAVCPPNDARRPSYVLGHFEKDV